MENLTLTMKQVGPTLEVDREEFAVHLKMWRIRKGLSQIQAAKVLGLSRFTVIEIEKGRHVSMITAYRVFNKLAEELRKEGIQ